MAVTKEQITSANPRDEFHYTGNHACTRVVGPRGGIRETITRVRVNGVAKTWKRQPELFVLPVAYGMFGHERITNENANEWHSADTCPLAS